MSTIAPKDKAFLDIKLVQECMDVQAKRIAIAFAAWLAEEREENQIVLIDSDWYLKDDIEGDWPLTEETLYNKFIESITK